MLNANRPSVIMLSVVKAWRPMLYCYAKYHYTEFHFAQCLYAKCRLARIQDAVFIDILCAVLLNVIYAECCFSVIFTVCLVSFFYFYFYATCCFAECNIFIVMLSVVTTSVIFLSVAASSKRIWHCPIWLIIMLPVFSFNQMYPVVYKYPSLWNKTISIALDLSVSVTPLL